MRSLLLLVALAGAHAMTEEYLAANAKSMWGGFKTQYGRNFTGEEDAARFGIFTANMLHAVRLQAQEGADGATFGVTKFADLTTEEFRRYRALHKRPASLADIERVAFTEAERAQARATTSKDWRDDHAVTGVKDQGNCGSCWAFSAVGGIEGGQFVHNGRLVSLSEQELTSCEKNDDGCNGGLQENAFDFLVRKHKGGIVTEKAYPYTSGRGKTGKCKSLSGLPVGATIKGYSTIKRNADDVKAALLKHGPLAVSVDAGPWQTYTGGILKKGCTQRCDLDHGVTLVGFGEQKNTQFWIVKNSWAADWGENGYIRVELGHGGITDEALIVNF